MDGFKKLPKQIACFKEGGSIQREVKNFTKRDRKTVDEADTAQDKKVVKKAFGIHDSQLHEEKTDLSGLKKGGRAKKAVGTVKKFKTGGLIAVKPTGDKKAEAPNAATKRPALKGSDVAKEKNKPAGDKDSIKKSVKKMADGGGLPAAALQGALPGGQGQGSANDMERRRMMARAKMAMQTLGPAQQSQFVNQGGMSPTGVSPAPAPVPAPTSAPGLAPAPTPALPAQKKGGKVKGKC